MPKILLVEDEESQRNILRDHLAKRGFSILEAKDGIEGLEISLHEHPDLIILDVRMPNMDGITMMHKLRQNNWGKKASIIILTNYDTDDTQLLQIAKDLPSYYLMKADTPLDKILEKIEKELKSKERG